MKISLITCVYNTEPYLRICFDSILSQKYNDFEVVVVNDGSDDNSQKIIDEYVNKDKRFVSISLKHGGQAIARNKGIEVAKGEYIVFVDSDDAIKENYLLKLSEIIDKNIDFGYARMTRIYNKKANILEKKFNYIHAYPANITNTYDNPESLTRISNSPCAKIYRKKFLQDNNIVFYPNRLYEDLLFVLSVLLSNPLLTYINDDSYIYYIRSGSSMTGNGKRSFELLDVFDAVVEFASQKGCLDRFHDELEYLAFYHIAIGTMYRHFCYKPLMFFNSLKKCRSYLKKYKYNISNKYVKQMSFFERLYLYLLFNNL